MGQLENTLGAPTAGLGQLVTFSTNGQGGTPQQNAGQRGRVSGGLRGGQANLTSRAAIPNQQQDKTMSLLYKLGSDLLAPHVEAEQTAQFVSGMQAVAHGQAISDIVQEQPWYSKAFGSTSLIGGARAYSAHAKTQQTALEIEQAMPELRTKSADEAGKWFTDKIGSIKTGDAGTDAMVMSSLSKELPGLMSRRLKENLVWQSENLAQSVQSAWSASGSTLQAARTKAKSASSDGAMLLESGATTVESGLEDTLAEAKYVASFARPATVPAATWQSLITKQAVLESERGNLHALSALQRNGVIAQLTPEQQITVSNATQRASSQAKVNLSPELQERYTKLAEVFRGTDVEAAKAAIDDYNTRFMESTGSPTPAITGHERATTVVRMQQEIYKDKLQEQEAMRRAAEKATNAVDKEVKQATLLNTAYDNVLNPLRPMPIANLEPKEQEALFNMAKARNQRTEMAFALYADKGHTNANERNNMTNLMSAGASNPVTFDNIYRTQYLPLIRKDANGDEDKSVAIAYFANNPRHADMMTIYHDAIRAQPNAGAEYLGAAHARAIQVQGQDLQRNAKGELVADDKALLNAATEFLKTKDAYFVMEDNIPKESKEDFARRLKGYIASGVKEGTSSERIQWAVSKMRSMGVENLGGHIITANSQADHIIHDIYAVKNDKGIPLVAHNPGETELHSAFTGYLDHTKSKNGIESGIQVFQFTDTANTKRIAVMGLDKNQYPIMYTMTAKEIAEYWDTTEKAAKASREVQAPLQRSDNRGTMAIARPAIPKLVPGQQLNLR